MPHENRSPEPTRSSAAVAYSHNSSGISQPAVHPLQIAQIEIQNEDDGPIQMFDGRSLQIKAFSIPHETRNGQTVSPDIKPFQLRPPAQKLANPVISAANAPVQGSFEATLIALISTLGLSSTIIWGFVALLGIAIVVKIISSCKESGQDIIGALNKAKSSTDKENIETEAEKPEKEGSVTKRRRRKKGNKNNSNGEDAEENMENEQDESIEIADDDEAFLRLGQRSPETKRPTSKVAATPRILTVPTEAEYNDKVVKAATLVKTEMNKKLNGIGDPYGSIDVYDGWSGYQLMGKTKEAYQDDIMTKVMITYPQSADSATPYYNWVSKRGRWYGNYTKKDRKDENVKATVNIHFDF
jgi:hypothetical protein